MFHPGYVILIIQRLQSKIVDPVEVINYKLPHLDLRYLQINHFSSQNSLEKIILLVSICLKKITKNVQNFLIFSSPEHAQGELLVDVRAVRPSILSCVHSRGHSFDLIYLKHCQNGLDLV